MCSIDHGLIGIRDKSRPARTNPINSFEEDAEDAENGLPPPPKSHLWTSPVAGVSVPSLVFALLALGILAAALMDWKVLLVTFAKLTY
jgi:hypothetical protein